MPGINKAIILGRLGKDPEMRYTQSGTAIANLSVATSETWKDKTSGEPQEQTEWHRVSIFGKLAEIAGQYLTKGSQVYLEGKIKTRKWQDQSGADRYSTEIVLNGFDSKLEMLGGRGQGQGSTQGPQTAQGGAGAFQEPGGDEFSDDIPFDLYMRGAEWSV